jgi:cytochrome c biogenesis protein CcdA
MNKKALFFPVLLILLLAPVLAQTQVDYFYGTGCPHCATVAESGILEKVGNLENVSVTKYEIYYDDEGRNKFTEVTESLGIPQFDRGVPMAVIECEGNFSYLVGDKPIIENLEERATICEGTSIQGPSNPQDPSTPKVTLWAIIIAALIDSINPCAFGVLIFLMISLLKMGSNKRALKAGLIYTAAVFTTYFLAGFGIFKAIQTFTSVTYYIYLAAGLLVLGVGILEFIDFFRKDKPSILRITPKAKPMIVNIMHKGTIPAMILLGIVVSLFELPCTGGIYLAILTTMSINKTFGVPYLLLYNLIFVLPLIVLTLLIYKGTSPESLQKWTSKEKRWMKFAAGVVMVALGIYILNSIL